MHFRYFPLLALTSALMLFVSFAPVARGQGATTRAQSDATPYQRLEVVRSRLETMRRSLNGAVSGLNTSDAKKSDKKNKEAGASDDAATRLRGLVKETDSLLSDVTDLRGKVDRAEKYDAEQINKLESAVSDLNGRVEAALRATAGERRGGASASAKESKKKKPGLFGRLLGHGGDDKYADLIGTVQPGRDRELFAEASKQACKGNYEEARLLFNVIITTYPESPFLPAAKLAIADTFYLDGTTSSLIQGGAAYQEWLTFFPTDSLSDHVLLKIAEVEMRQMGLPDRTTEHARKAEQRLKALLQQYPDTALRPDVEQRLREVQENLGMHVYEVGNFYYDRFQRHVAPNPKGAQSRYLEVVQKYPNFSKTDAVLYRLGSTYIDEEEPDEAAKYFQQLVRNHPNSEFTDKAREQLSSIGAEVPEPDPTRMKETPPEPASFMHRTLSEVLGSVDVTVNKDGVLINRDCKGNSLLELALQNNGQLPVTTPTAPVTTRRSNPTPATTDKPGVKLQPTRPGPPATGDSIVPTTPPDK